MVDRSNAPLVLVTWLLLSGVAPVEADHMSGHLSSSTEPSHADPLRGLLGPQASTGSDEEPFLPPDEAFALSLAVLEPRTLTARWLLADTYYLYRKAFGFSALTAGIVLGPPVFPPALEKQDPYFGRVEVYYGEVQVTLPIERRAPDVGALTLELRYQGCTDRGLCYPPTTRTMSIELPPP